MADDTRQPNRPQKKNLSREALTIHPDHKRFSGSQWDDPKSQITKPPENANMMPGGTEHTAGGKTPEVSIKEAFPKLDDWSRFHKLPCVRNALLYGMTTGFALAGMRVIFSAPLASICNWAAGGFLVVSPASYTYCQRQRYAEKEGMNRVMEIMYRKDVEKKARDARREKAREERRALKDQELDAQLGAANSAAAVSDARSQKPWWKVW